MPLFFMLAMTGKEAETKNDADARVRTEIYGTDCVVALTSDVAQEKIGDQRLRQPICGGRFRACKPLNLRTCHRNGAFESYWEYRAA